MFVKTERKELTSVGVDIGTATFHLIFSKLVLEKDSRSRTEKFEVAQRDIIHMGPIHLTPLKGPNMIDFEKLHEYLLEDYKSAGLALEDIDTGAVIVTGESARRENAESIVRILAGEVGKFVAATAGPNFESVLAAHGAGIVERSRETGRVIMNVDIGGGSSNIAVCKDGRVIDTAAINVGGRLIAFDSDGKVARLENAGQRVAKSLGIEVELGTVIGQEDIVKIAGRLADSLLEAIMGTTESATTNDLMMTPSLKLPVTVDEVTFSGGVAEFIYEREDQDFGDLGRYLAEEIRRRMTRSGLELGRPEHMIRATVIGAGQSSLRVSGSTTFLSPGIDLPIRNVPVIEPHLTINGSVQENVRTAIENALKRFDLRDGDDEFVLAFNGSVKPSYSFLSEFGKGLVAALPRTVRKNKSILLCFSDDVGNSVGNVMKRETGVASDVLSIDEIHLHEGDFVDIGRPVIEGVVVPVIVKTLVFGESVDGK